MDWLDTHITEVILPNLASEVIDLTGIRLDPTLGEFKVIATALDPEEELNEEFEITIHFGKLCLVDACFLLEEVETGSLPLCQNPEELTESLVQAKLDYIRDTVVPALREEFQNELAQNQWDPMLAHKLDITPEVLAPATEMRSSGGYPPMALVIRHPDFDPDNFEISIRIDPMTRHEWVQWDRLMERVNQALRAIGEEPVPDAPAQVAPSTAEPEGPSAADLEDTELTELEAEAAAGAPAPAASGKETGAGAAVPDALLAQLQSVLGGLGAQEEEPEGQTGKGAAKKGARKKGSSKGSGKAPAAKAASRKKKAPSKKAGGSKAAKKSTRKASAEADTKSPRKGAAKKSSGKRAGKSSPPKTKGRSRR